jgi:hypothetical protein
MVHTWPTVLSDIIIVNSWFGISLNFATLRLHKITFKLQLQDRKFKDIWRIVRLE